MSHLAHISAHSAMDRQTDGPTDQWTNWPMDRLTDGPTDGLMNKASCRVGAQHVYIIRYKIAEPNLFSSDLPSKAVIDDYKSNIH